MNSISALDHYRIAVLRDSQLTRLLAVLYHLETSDPKNLQAIMNLPASEIYSGLDKLFRSNLVNSSVDDRWRISDLGKHVLTRSGIGGEVAKSLLEPAMPSNIDRSFFYTYFRYNSEYAPLQCESLIDQTRCVNYLLSFMDDKRAANQLYYGALVGHDLEIKTLGEDLFLRNILNHSTPRDQLEYHRKVLTRKIKSARKMFETSNRLLLELCYSKGDFQPTKKADKPSGPMFYLLWLRILSALKTRRADLDLSTIARTEDRVFEITLRALSKWRPSIEQDTYDYLIRTGTYEIKLEIKSRNRVRVLLLDWLKTSAEVPLDPRAERRSGWSVDPFGTPKKAETPRETRKHRDQSGSQ